MEKHIGILVCIMIIVLDVVAGILGIEAEIAQNKVRHVRLWIFECRDPSHKAFKLGISAAALMALAHSIANVLGGCRCIWSKEELERATANRQLAVACLFLSWIILAFGFSTLIIGALANTRSRGHCGISHHHFLSIGGILCFVHGLFSIAYYVSATAVIREERRSREAHTPQRGGGQHA